MTSMLFRRKPIVVEAMQFRTTYKGAQKIIDWINKETGWTPEKNTDPPVMYYYGDLTIKTLEGEIHASDRDFIVKGVEGEFYPVKPSIFKKTFDPVRTSKRKVSK